MEWFMCTEPRVQSRGCDFYWWSINHLRRSTN